jgi:spore coat protein U-like protein
MNMSKKNILRFAGALLCATAIATPVAIAATATTTFQVTATVLSVCSVSATNLAFGNYDASAALPTDASSTVTVTCTPSETYDLGLDAGVGAGATVAVRRMTNGANTLDYSLFQDAGRATVWGETIGTDTQAGTGNGAGQAFTVYGRIPTAQYVAAGNYSDTITATVTY